MNYREEDRGILRQIGQAAWDRIEFTPDTFTEILVPGNRHYTVDDVAFVGTWLASDTEMDEKEKKSRLNSLRLAGHRLKIRLARKERGINE